MNISNQDRIMRRLAVDLGLVFGLIFTTGVLAQSPNKFESKLIGRWVLN